MGHAADPADQQIDEYIARSRLLNGKEIVERPPWNTCATADAIRHFSYGTSDSNPLWLDKEYARDTLHGSLLAPPTFLCSVLYPFLHGAPMQVPLSSLIGKVQMEWFQPIREGDRLRASARQSDVSDSFDRRGRRLIYIDAETTYWNQRDEVVGKALGTMVRVARCEGDLLVERDIYRYDEAERMSIREAIEAETRVVDRAPVGAEIWVGQCLPVFVRGPLTIGDLVCWQAAIGPSYRAGTLGYQDLLQSPHDAAINPITGWPVKYSQQHEDFLLAAQRGMPAPFDNSLMRFAWIAPMLTNWMGDAGVLKRLSIQTDAPILYGDTTWYRGIVSGKRLTAEGESVSVTIKISGVNQLGQTTTSGEAEVILPAHRPRTTHKTRAERKPPDMAAVPDALGLIRAQVETRPDVVAVQCGDDDLTFAELDAQANQLAHLLTSHGAAPGAFVGLMLERNLNAVVVILATLKAGCTYVPLDSSLPAEKLRQILACISLDVLLAPTARLASCLEVLPPSAAAPATGCKLLGFDAIRDAIPNHRADEPPACPVPDDLAYVMPTSGTRGVPRLVAVTHGSLGRCLQSLREPLGITAQDICLHTAAFSFSASVRQLFFPLSMGARLVLADAEQRLDPLALWKLIKHRGVTIWDTVPSVWRSCLDTFALLAGPERAELLDDDLRLILTTGEALPWKIPYTWRKEFGHSARIVNLYSQTETAGTVCVYPVPEWIPEPKGFVPLGRPVDFTSVHLLDTNLTPVSPGATGEICVSGSRLALGYFGQSELTAECFPLRPYHHEGFYRTGDLARRGADGILEFVGRADHRVKIRGQRVELGEVEEALRAHPAVEDAVVLLHENEQGRARLVAYLVGRAGTIPDPGQTLAHLRHLVPDAALPEMFIPMERLPRNPAGKVDRTALPTPMRVQASQAVSATSLDGSLEQAIERIFANALELRHVGNEENFFDLGGNSLLAMQVITRLRTIFSAQFPMVRFFEKPTVAAVAAAIGEYLLQEVEGLTDEEAVRLFGEESEP